MKFDLTSQGHLVRPSSQEESKRLCITVSTTIVRMNWAKQYQTMNLCSVVASVYPLRITKRFSSHSWSPLDWPQMMRVIPSLSTHWDTPTQRWESSTARRIASSHQIWGNQLRYWWSSTDTSWTKVSLKRLRRSDKHFCQRHRKQKGQSDETFRKSNQCIWRSTPTVFIRPAPVFSDWLLWRWLWGNG